MNAISARATGRVPRIEHVTITPIAFRDVPLLAASGMHEPWTPRTIVEITCEGGSVGLSETFGDTATIEDLRAVGDAIIGLPVTDFHALRRAVADRVRAASVDAHQPSVISPRTDARLRIPRIFGALEVGCLDAFARHLEVPLCEILGGRLRDKVPFAAYLFYKTASHPDLDEPDPWGEVLTPEAVVEEAREMVARFGFRSLKLKGGVLPPEEELDAVALLAEAFPDHPLRIDPNGNWSVERTLPLLNRMEGLLEYLEDPVLGNPAMARIQAATTMPLATNMCVTGFHELPEAVRLGAVKVILADHHFWGGLQETLHLNRMCEVFGMSLSMHSNTHLGISLMAMSHVAAACSCLMHDCDTHYPWLKEDVVADGLIPFEDGAVRLSDAPGLGVELDRAALARMAEAYARCGPSHRDDTIFIRKLWPDWTAERPRFAAAANA